MIENGLSKLLKKLKNGYCERTPNGVHFLCTCDEIGGSTKLATRPKKPSEMRDKNDKTKTLIETKGEGGYIICAPSHGGVNDSGEYRLVSGSLSLIPKIKPSEREDLFSIAKTFHVETKKKRDSEKDNVCQETRKIAGRPGDDYNQRVQWKDLLECHGWTCVSQNGEVSYWCRPGKSEGVSATLNYQGNDLFHCFTTSTDFEQRSYDKFGVYAILNHGGDYKAAARQLAEEGYGNQHTANSGQYGASINTNVTKCPDLPEEAMPGWIGKFVKLACKDSEAHPSAVLIALLLRFCAEILGPYVRIGDAKHRARTNAVIVGATSRARKGTSFKPVEVLFDGLENCARVSPGPLSTGEGLVEAVRDERCEFDTKKQIEVIVDPGVTDKRLFVFDEELANALASIHRKDNALSGVIRRLHDDGNVEPLIRHNKYKTTGAHVVILTNITTLELTSNLDKVQMTNGFANRFLWLLVHRTKNVSLPPPFPAEELEHFRNIVAECIEAARGLGEMYLSEEAQNLYTEVYDELTTEYPGFAGAIVGRSEAHVVRLALIYALAAGHSKVETQDLLAALALVKTSNESVFIIFKDNDDVNQGDKRKDKILKALSSAPKNELSKSGIYAVFNRKISSSEVDKVMQDLVSSKDVIIMPVKKTGGADKTIYKLVTEELD